MPQPYQWPEDKLPTPIEDGITAESERVAELWHEDEERRLQRGVPYYRTLEPSTYQTTSLIGH